MSEQAYKTPLVDLLRNVPKDHRTEWPIQWAENGAETGHALCPIGKLAHEAADRIAELEAAHAQAGDAVGEVYFDAHDAANVFWFAHPQEGAKLYTAPPAAAIHYECCKCSVSETTGWTQQAVCNVCNRIVEGVGYDTPAAVNRQDLIDLLIATRTQSEGVTADLIIEMVGAKPAVNQQLPEGYVLAPVEPTEAMIDMGVAVAFAASVHGKGGWNNYMNALYRAFIEAAQEQK